MAGTSQITPVDDIAQDDHKLEEKATQLSGVDLVIDPETIGTDFEMVDSSVRAILVKKHSAGGAVRVFGNPIRNVVTGPNEGAGFVIVIVGPGETCRLFGSPSIRYFRRCSS
ncbi:hypothetical protein AOQ84DRAFT_359276 [Glonium stellatum]|uniref:Uncharacterized protein n=1 Tax=Glonium stellatum TaxID=574774 RepID=A0A8E2JYP4_9PEZI|nr:hypothetical protein AOQ84DRAFT_359276 [Glonium stellatum]